MRRNNHLSYSIIIFFALLVFIFNCNGNDSKLKHENATEVASNTTSALPKSIKSPKDNVTSEEKLTLGRFLFYDPILSGNKDVACATCHHPSNGYAEFLDLSIGVNGKGFGSKRAFKTPNTIPLVKRNAHTVLNTAFNGIDFKGKYDPEKAPMFWDNRIESLEKQALEPIKSFEEMRGTRYSETEILTVIVERLKQIPKYQSLFKDAFKEENAITSVNLGKAIATFERSLVTNNSRFDNYMRGNKNAISLSEKEGFNLFQKVGCINCHKGPMFSDYEPHVLGVPENDKLTVPDRGFEDLFAFRTPSLRNLRYTAPYMHNGTFNNLKQILEFYEDISFGKTNNPLIPKENLDPLIDKLELKVKDMSLIISFLNTLNDTNFDKEVPESVPSGLMVGGHIQ